MYVRYTVYPCTRVSPAVCDRVFCALYSMDTTMALPGEREREKREHPNTPLALPAPAFGRETLACSPHGCDPTAGVRDGMNASCLASSKDKPPTASQDGIATCAARRPPAEERQGTRMQPRAKPRPTAKERERERGENTRTPRWLRRHPHSVGRR